VLSEKRVDSESQRDIISRAITELSGEKEIFIENVNDQKAVYLASFRKAETGLAQRLKGVKRILLKY